MPPRPGDLTPLVAGYGIGVAGLPPLGPLAVTVPPALTLEWRLGTDAFAPPVPDPTPETWWWDEREDGFVHGWVVEAEYRVKLHPTPGVEVILGPASEAEAALSFLLAVLPLGLPLFGLEPLHGAALAAEDGRAVLVMGQAESGKSTTALALRDRGFRFLADDACALDADGRLWPGPPMLATRSPDSRDVAFASYDEKSVVAIDPYASDPLEPGGAVVLRPGAGAALELHELPTAEAFREVLAHVRAPWAFTERRRALQLRVASLVAQHPVAVVTFDHRRHPPGRVADLVAGFAASR